MSNMQPTTEQIATLESRLAALEAQPSTALARGHVHGLTLSNDTGSPNTHITVAVGKCRDRDDSVDLNLGSPLTKNLGAAWSAGDGGGALDTGAKANSTAYHWFLIYNPTSLAYDILASASLSNPVLPTGFTKYRRLGAVITNASGNIRAFLQKKNYFSFKPAGRLLDISAASNASPSAFIRQVGVPTGKKFHTHFYFLATGSASASQWDAVLDPDDGIPTNNQATDYGQIDRNSSNRRNGTLWQWTDSNRQVYTISNDASAVITLMVLGWNDDLESFE